MCKASKSPEDSDASSSTRKPNNKVEPTKSLAQLYRFPELVRSLCGEFLEEEDDDDDDEDEEETDDEDDDARAILVPVAMRVTATPNVQVFCVLGEVSNVTIPRLVCARPAKNAVAVKPLSSMPS